MRSKTKKSVSILVSAVLMASLSLLLVACGDSGSTSASSSSAINTPAAKTVITVGATPSPHGEILQHAAAALAAEGYELKVIEYTDYVKPNLDTDTNDTDANYFQHLPYLEDFNTQNKTNLVSVAAIHFEPLGIYAGKTSVLADLPDGAKVAVPNDTTNEARALLLLEAQGLITLPANASLSIMPKDITSNPKNLQFVEVEAAQVPLQLGEVNIAVINGNYALDAKLDPKTVLAAEGVNSEAARTYANIIVVKSGHENLPETQALVKVLTSDDMRTFINNTYAGVVVPVF